jgi:heme exporter protein A
VQLIAENLVLQRGHRTLIDKLSFTLTSGEVLLLTGPNGAGKTTLLRSLAGFFRPAAGRSMLKGGNDELSVGEQAHFIGHTNGVKSSLSVAENLKFWAHYMDPRASRPSGLDRIDRALEVFRLSALADIPAGYLSAGQKRRLGLARLVLAHRPLWLLDEPTSSLDDASALQLAGVVNEHVAAGGLAVAATHLPLGFKPARELRIGQATLS